MLKAKTHRNVNISAQMDLIVLQWWGEYIMLRSRLWRGQSMTDIHCVFFCPGMVLFYWQCVWDRCHFPDGFAMLIQIWLYFSTFMTLSILTNSSLAWIQHQPWRSRHRVSQTDVAFLSWTPPYKLTMFHHPKDLLDFSVISTSGSLEVKYNKA